MDTEPTWWMPVYWDTTEFEAYPTYTIAGGNQLIALHLAQTLPNIQLNCPIEYVVRQTNGYRVGNGKTQWDADAVIVASPASVMNRIRFEPQLPLQKLAALENTTYGQAAKLFVGLKEPAVPSAVISVPDGYWSFTGCGANGQVLPLVGCFAGPMESLNKMNIDQSPNEWVDALARCRPELALDRSQVLLSTWHNDEWVRGVYTVKTPLTPLGNAEMLAEPVDGIHFCGEHTSVNYYGYMEGALQSGIRAATEILK